MNTVYLKSLLIFLLLFLLQRWLFQYLYGQNMVNERPPNGFKLNASNAMSGLVNGKTITSSLRRNGLPKIMGKYPFARR